MGTGRSQRHLLEIYGKDSGGNVTTPPPPMNYQNANYDGESIIISFSEKLEQPVPQRNYLDGFTVDSLSFTRVLTDPSGDAWSQTGIPENIFYATLAPQAPQIQTGDVITISYDDTVGTVTSAQGAKLASFTNLAVINTAPMSGPPAEPFVAYGPAQPQPWIKFPNYSTITNSRVIVVANDRAPQGTGVPLDDPGRDSVLFAPGSGKNWSIAAAEYYCNARGIPLGNIVKVDCGPSSTRWRRFNNPTTPTYTFWKDTFCQAIKTKMDAMETAGSGCQAVLLAPGVPFSVETDDSLGGLGSFMCLGTLAASVRRIFADTWYPQGVSGSGSGIISLVKNTVYSNLWEPGIDWKLIGSTDATLVAGVYTATTPYYSPIGNAKIATELGSTKLGDATNLVVAGGKIGLSAGRNTTMYGFNNTPYPGTYDTEVESTAKDVIDNATAAMALTSAARFNSSRSEPFLVHIANYAGAESQDGPPFVSAARYSLNDWGFTDVRYYYRQTTASSNFAWAELWSPIANQNYFVKPSDIIFGGVWKDKDPYTIQVQNERVSSQIGAVRNEDQFTAPWQETWKAPVGAYRGHVFNMNPSTPYNYGRMHNLSGGFSWMEQIYHKGGNDPGLQASMLSNALLGMTMAEAHYYSDINHASIEMPTGDPLWRPFPTGP